MRRSTLLPPLPLVYTETNLISEPVLTLTGDPIPHPVPLQATIAWPTSSRGNFLRPPVTRIGLPSTFDANLFFLVISPPQEMIQRIFDFKRLAQNSIGHSYDSAFSIAHISLFQYQDVHNESLLYSIKEKVARIKSFKVFIKDFNLFRSNGTIYLDIVNKSAVNELTENVFNKSITPHLTIARNLTSEDLDIVWPKFKVISYSHFFECKSVTVLKWGRGKWDNYLEFPLACLNKSDES